MKYCFMRFPGGKSKALTLSYDDGCIHDKRLIEIVNRYNIKVTMNVNSECFGEKPGDWRLMADEILKLAESGGHEIAVHGARHIAPGKVSAVNGIQEFLDCRRALEHKFNRIIRGMAYPDTGITEMTSGVTKGEVKAYLKALGIVYARSLEGDNDRFDLPEDWLEWIPTAHHINPELMNYINKFVNDEPRKKYVSKQNSKLFYLWGHSFEFGNNDSWDVLEKFCETAAGRDDVWYATNIEIYDYVEAYRSLQFSADNTLLYNPTLYTIYFDMDENPFKIKPGETIRTDI